jgi:hypothetical protein
MSTTPATDQADNVPIPVQIDLPPEPTDLTDDQKAVRKATIAEIVPTVFSQIHATLEADYAEKLGTAIETIDLKYGEKLNQEMVKFRQSLTPPTPAEIKKLLTQTYETFPVPIPAKNGEERVFTIVEVPQSIELKFTSKLEASIAPKLKELSAFKMVMTEANVEEQITHIVQLLSKSLAAMAEITVIVLNPFNEHEDVDVAWVQNNLSSYRMLQIIQAQIHCNRLRDFFLQLFQFTRQ